MLPALRVCLLCTCILQCCEGVVIDRSQTHEELQEARNNAGKALAVKSQEPLVVNRWEATMDEIHTEWIEAMQRANATVQELTPLERNSLLQGIVGPYVGTTQGVPRLGIPALKMQDAAQGFRPTSPELFGTTTSWPCGLAMAATFDEVLVGEVATGIAKEFLGKGANVILGPVLNVVRVARGGRNFESLSGEDPHLGQQLAYAFILSAQKEGVMTVSKHHIFNEQETNRMTESSEVDERTSWELYYRPFAAASMAGTGGVMCSYNKVNGTYACGNSFATERDLRGVSSFQGFVVSDWYATHGAGNILKGLDMEMPGSFGYFTDGQLATLPSSALDTAAARVLKSIYSLHLDKHPGCELPCTEEINSNQTSAAHRQLASKAATASVILLKNSGILPLDVSVTKKLLVIGEPAIAPKESPYYAGGGSGHVPPSSVVTPLSAIQQRGLEGGFEVLYLLGSPLPASAEVLVADAVIVVAATSSTEGADRPSLSLDGNADELISFVGGLRPTVVLMQTPGAVLTPWREEVAAIANLFLGGQETGTAWARVLFGDTAPSGRLPVMMPATVADTIEPGTGPVVRYTEGQFTSYRSTTFRAAFPFGHGLSYTSFTYSAPVLEREVCPGDYYIACVSCIITNSGTRAGAEIAQVYFRFLNAPPDTPPLRLSGIRKTELLEPGASEKVVFSVNYWGILVWNSTKRGFHEASDEIEMLIGASSADIRHAITVPIREQLEDLDRRGLKSW